MTITLIVALALLMVNVNTSQWRTYYPTLKAGQHKRTSLLDVDCQCKSIFTLGACGVESVKTNLLTSKNWRRTMTRLKMVRSGNPNPMTDSLHELSRYLPSILMPNNLPNTNNTNKIIYQYSISNNTSNHTNFIEMKEKLRKYRQAIPVQQFLPCEIHKYTEHDIYECLKEREQITGRVLKIAFVGDSQVRNLMEQMVLHLRVQLNLTVDNESGLNLSTQFLDNKAKYDLPVLGKGLELRLYWASFLAEKRDKEISRQGALDLFQVWAQNKTTKNGEEVPDIIYFDDGMWATGDDTEHAAVAMVIGDFYKLLPYFQKISRTTRLILRTHTPVKRWVAKRKVPNAGLDLMNQAEWLAFQKSEIWMWDTISPFYLKEYDECLAYWRTGMGKNLPKLWACHDFQHPSKISEGIAANYIWNYVCNGIRDLTPKHCCS